MNLIHLKRLVSWRVKCFRLSSLVILQSHYSLLIASLCKRFMFKHDPNNWLIKRFAVKANIILFRKMQKHYKKIDKISKKYQSLVNKKPIEPGKRTAGKIPLRAPSKPVGTYRSRTPKDWNELNETKIQL